MSNKISNCLSAACAAKVPEKLVPWLCYEDSLTDKLKQLTGDASIHALGHQWCRPGWWEKYVLGIEEQLIFVREAVMYSNQTKCWYAKTLAPQSTYLAHKDFFARLEKNALNVMLFEEKLAQRQSLQCYTVTKSELEFYWVKRWLFPHGSDNQLADLVLWVRRSCFLIANKDLCYVIEIFLPELMDLIP